MNIKTLSDIKKFEEAVEECRSIVWLVTPDDKSYNLKSDTDYPVAMEYFANDVDNNAEIFTSNHDDEAIMLRYFFNRCA